MIGAGAYGEVWRCTHAASEYAVKRLRPEVVHRRGVSGAMGPGRSPSFDALLEEYEMMRALRHPNVLLLIGIATDFHDNTGSAWPKHSISTRLCTYTHTRTLPPACI